jgi:uroporphyrinogen III methyltransferase/synthase
MDLTLKHKRIIITRARQQALELSELLASKGAEPIPFPTIEIKEPSSWEPLDQALNQLEQYSWLIFTSANGVKKFFERLKGRAWGFPSETNLKIAAIGPATARAIEERGINVECFPEDFVAEGLVETLKNKILPGMKVLIPRARVAREILPNELRRMGAIVEVVEAYQTVLPTGGREAFLHLLDPHSPDMIIFTSSSTVLHLAEMLVPAPLPEVLGSMVVACIGPITAEVSRKLGLNVAVIPCRYDVPSLVAAIEDFFSANLR